ncbi:MAG: hypothetical protein VKP63_10585 [Cyanobacteriota bacterium]|nr:hypothetical protein [Cyanobacteriota bacterium]
MAHPMKGSQLLAASVALVALGGVNRYERCRDHAFAPGCLWRDAGGVVEVASTTLPGGLTLQSVETPFWWDLHSH